MTTIKERPILFSGAMVRALLAGDKTLTRRAIKGIDIKEGTLPNTITFTRKTKSSYTFSQNTAPNDALFGLLQFCPYGQPGERLWVRETHALLPKSVTYSADKMVYRADASEGEAFAVSQIGGWKPSIFMKRAASRLLLEIVAVRVERVQDITDADIEAEGVKPTAGHMQFAHRHAWKTLWEDINGPESWAANPWVWVVEFKVIEGGKEVASAQ